MPHDERQDAGADRAEDRVVRPLRFGDEVVQRLVGRLHAPRLHACGHRLDALASTREEQPRAIRAERRAPISMPQHRRHRLDIGHEPSFAAARPR